MFYLKKFEKEPHNVNKRVEEKCFVSHMNKHYFKLCPIKIEVIKQNPVQVIVFHSFLTVDEIERLKSYNAVEVS